MNLKNIINLLPCDIDGVFISSAENRLYFTNFSSSAGYLLATKNGCVFLTDSRYIEAARNTVKGCDVVELKKLSEQLPDLCQKLNCKCLAIESKRMTLSEFKKLKKLLAGVKILDSDIVEEMINGLRMIKNKKETEKIKTAQAIAEKAFYHILNFIKIGVTEKEVSLELDFFMLKNGAHGLSFDTIVVSGKNSSMPHGVASDKKIEKGDFITMDFGAVFEGYHSDMTRTVAIGSVNDKQLDVYQTVLNAQLSSLELIRSGILCAQADAAARDFIEKAGYGRFFRHSMGHGVGIEIHEQPSLSPSYAGTLKEGNVVTVEPGIYLPGEFGVRIEDMVIVKKNGCENLTHCKKELIIL